MGQTVMTRIGLLSAVSLLAAGAATAAPRAKKASVADPTQNLRLEGVTALGDHASAWLVDRSSGRKITVAPGEAAFGFTVKQVAPERVVLSRGGREFTLHMGDQAQPIISRPSTVMASGGTPARNSLHLRRTTGTGADTGAAPRTTVGTDGIQGGPWVFDRRSPSRTVEPDQDDTTDNGTTPNRGVYPEEGALTNGRGVYPSPVNPLGISGNTGDPGAYPAYPAYPNYPGGPMGAYPDNRYGNVIPGPGYPVTTYPGGYPWSTGYSGMNPWNLPYGSWQPGTNAAATTGLFGNPQTNRRSGGVNRTPSASPVGQGNPQTLRRRGQTPSYGQ